MPAEINSNPTLKIIPVIALTTSTAPSDMRAYELQANWHVTRPVDLQALFETMAASGKFWIQLAKLPKTSEMNCSRRFYLSGFKTSNHRACANDDDDYDNEIYTHCSALGHSIYRIKVIEIPGENTWQAAGRLCYGGVVEPGAKN